MHLAPGKRPNSSSLPHCLSFIFDPTSTVKIRILAPVTSTPSHTLTCSSAYSARVGPFAVACLHVIIAMRPASTSALQLLGLVLRSREVMYGVSALDEFVVRYSYLELNVVRKWQATEESMLIRWLNRNRAWNGYARLRHVSFHLVPGEKELI